MTDFNSRLEQYKWAKKNGISWHDVNTGKVNIPDLSLKSTPKPKGEVHGGYNAGAVVKNGDYLGNYAAGNLRGSLNVNKNLNLSGGINYNRQTFSGTPKHQTSFNLGATYKFKKGGEVNKYPDGDGVVKPERPDFSSFDMSGFNMDPLTTRSDNTQVINLQAITEADENEKDA